MKPFFEGQVLWSQMDANQHMRYSAYADFAARARLNMFGIAGIPLNTLKLAKIGPVISREE